MEYLVVPDSAAMSCGTDWKRSVIQGAMSPEHGYAPNSGQQQFGARLQRADAIWDGAHQRHIGWIRNADQQCERRDQMPADLRWRWLGHHGRWHADVHVLLRAAFRARGRRGRTAVHAVPECLQHGVSGRPAPAR